MEEFKRIFKKFHNRLIMEGILKALMISSSLGFLVAFIIALCLFIFSYNAIWISIVSFAVITIISTIICYFFKYKPSKEDVARRVDLEGLEERVITMVELKDEESFMAKKQREDTINEVNKVKNIKLKFKFSKNITIATSIISVISILTVALTGFSLGGFLPSYSDIAINQPLEDITISYEESTGGVVVGPKSQVVKEGEDTIEVCALPELGYMFSIWSDGIKTPNRQENDVKESINVTAIFVPINESQDGGFIEDKDAPKADFEMGEMEGQMPDGMIGGAGKYEEYNQVIDGETYYRDILKEYYNEAQEIINSGGVVPEYLRIIIDEYYSVIK